MPQRYTGKMPPTLAPAPPPMRSQSHADQDDRSIEEQLLGAVQDHQRSSQAYQGGQHHSSHARSHHHNIDPAISTSGVMMANGPGSDDPQTPSSDSRKGKRELSTSKRAAQNRAAQRAFRQRKEGHIKSLEHQVREYSTLSESYKALQNENNQLRDYIISLQRRLLLSQGEFPQPPSNIVLRDPEPTPSLSSEQKDKRNESGRSAPSASAGDHSRAPTAPMRPYTADDLQASAAQAVAENDHRSDQARSHLSMSANRAIAV